jgi:hypothetical protein
MSDLPDYGPFLDLDGIQSTFLKGRVRCPYRKTPDGLFNGHALIRVPSPVWIAIAILPRDRGVNAHHRVVGFHREAETAGNHPTF